LAEGVIRYVHCRRRLGGLRFANPPYVLMALLTGWLASVVFRKD